MAYNHYIQYDTVATLMVHDTDLLQGTNFDNHSSNIKALWGLPKKLTFYELLHYRILYWVTVPTHALPPSLHLCCPQIPPSAHSFATCAPCPTTALPALVQHVEKGSLPLRSMGLHFRTPWMAEYKSGHYTRP
eukprot:scaffold16897_cov24-Tisochrysis_lutea.AAC.2